MINQRRYLQLVAISVKDAFIAKCCYVESVNSACMIIDIKFWQDKFPKRFTSVVANWCLFHKLGFLPITICFCIKYDKIM